MKKESLEAIEKFVDNLPQERKQQWSNFGGGWYDFVECRKETILNGIKDLVIEILDLESNSPQQKS